MNNFIALDNNDIITYNKIQSKIYKYFINHHKQYDFKFDKNAYEASVNYCKIFKYNVCLCYREKHNLDENYLELYKCSNKKRILYNTNNFNFIKPIVVNINNNKSYPIDIFNFYRQEYLPFIIQEKFNNFKINQIKLNTFAKKRLANYFDIIYSSQSYLTCLKYNFKQFCKQSKYNKTIQHNIIIMSIIMIL